MPAGDPPNCFNCHHRARSILAREYECNLYSLRMPPPEKWYALWLTERDVAIRTIDRCKLAIGTMTCDGDGLDAVDAALRILEGLKKDPSVVPPG